MSVNAANLYSAAQGERAAAARRAAEVRKKLLQGAAGAEGESSPEETLLIGQWLGSQQSQTPGEDQYHTGVPGKDPDFG
jgi:hypothetical protein